MDISIERRADGDAAVGLVVTGRIDAETGDDLEHSVAEELRQGHHLIRLDLTAVSFLSSAGIRVLFNIYRAAKAAGGSCLIGAASEVVTRVLELMKLAPLLMESSRPAEGRQGGASAVDAAPPAVAGTDIRIGRLLLLGLELGLEHSGANALHGQLVGGPDAALAGRLQSRRQPLPRHAFALGLAALADDEDLAKIAGEMLAAGGAVFHRAPQPFATVDYIVATGNLVPEAQLAAGLVWEGLPRGRAGFEPADEEPTVRFDELATTLLERSQSDCLAVVIVAEVHGLVGVELIRPLAEVTPNDHPRSSDPAVAATWLSFSREPVHARHTALIVGVITRGMPTGPLAEFVRPLGRVDVCGTVCGHAHAVVFPLRPLKRGPADLATTVNDLAASEPLAVMHLLGDPQPVLGSGQSELVRGCCWFAPLALAAGGHS